MDVKTALAQRKSTRAFLNKEVPIATINAILEQAKTAPSGVNTQPWKVAVLSGQSKKDLEQKMESEFRAGNKGVMDYQYYPEQWEAQYKDRRKACGLLMYSTLQIKREDKQRQLDQWAANYRAFDAPVMLLFFIDKVMEKGSYLDYGMFLQSIMLSAVEHGLATCPQAALAEYPEIVKKALGYEDQVLICGMALGYEDTTEDVNSYRTEREDLDKLVRYFS
ncbi:nitroreductase family protein [Candidatus Thioglobus sp.]|nr:nitroreductase family protein [Candidatus Thioglobus sp.]MDB3893654.1 nitroreductase family protein [Candidatus Thioglobus sp.]MDC0388807.1 nitroreductase family protein [Candidatus Thioglobus sp.]MDC0904376.1 nitroreductase family protein [Candidatus Thioglobus sp.]MDC0919901.1 nitroreductase family protein [Candidatus Thioglobus sp.]